MRLYWYWPFLRSEDIGLAEAVADDRLDRLVVHTLDRPGVPTASGNPRVTLRNDLPEISPARPGTPRWVLDRARVYRTRRRLRAAEIAGHPDLTHIWFLNRFTDAVDFPRLARTGRSSTSTNTGLVWEVGKMRSATQAERSRGTSKVTGTRCPSATMSWDATAWPFTWKCRGRGSARPWSCLPRSMQAARPSSW